MSNSDSKEKTIKLRYEILEKNIKDARLKAVILVSVGILALIFSWFISKITLFVFLPIIVGYAMLIFSLEFFAYPRNKEDKIFRDLYLCWENLGYYITSPIKKREFLSETIKHLTQIRKRLKPKGKLGHWLSLKKEFSTTFVSLGDAIDKKFLWVVKEGNVEKIKEIRSKIMELTLVFSEPSIDKIRNYIPTLEGLDKKEIVTESIAIRINT